MEQKRMPSEDLLNNRSDVYSQNGEDGIIAAIFERIGTGSRQCCEFGAWDGIHLSNCRNLIDQGWAALMIEADPQRFAELVGNYTNNPSVVCVNQYVDSGLNSLASILNGKGIGELDFLSIDIDGLDYEILETLDIHPRVICIEVNAGHNPENGTRLDREIARNNVGQPLELFVRTAENRGYDLVCYTGNAFFVRHDVVSESSLPVLTSKQAYENFLNALESLAKEWLYCVNLGLVAPYYQYHNCHLSSAALNIDFLKAIRLRSVHAIGGRIRRLMKWIAGSSRMD